MLEKIFYTAANAVLALFYLRQSLSFKRVISNTRDAQKRCLFRIIKRNEGTEFGKKHNFSSIRSISDFRSNIPVSKYESYTEYIELISGGKKNILTKDPVVMLEPTSGSTAPSKHIPYTENLRAEFQKGISPWIFDLFSKRKNLFFLAMLIGPSHHLPGRRKEQLGEFLSVLRMIVNILVLSKNILLIYYQLSQRK